MGSRTALIIANSSYEHDGLRALRSPSADADALAEVLGNRQVSDFEVRVVRDETAHSVQEHIEDLFAEGEPDDVLLLHFSCHGVKSESGELFFAARNTRPNRLASTAVPADFVRRCMRTSRSRSIVLLLDCCYGGAFSEGVAVRASGDVNVLSTLRGGRGRAVITASNSMEYAFEGDRLAEDHEPSPSVFTSALVRGLSTGEADRDEDGLISLNELYDYVFEQVRLDNPNQTPSRDIEMQGELYLARSRRRRIKPQPMPADLRAATVDPNMFTRLGAVAELRLRLTSTNLEIAAGAHLALTEMAHTDISNIASAAADALQDVAVRPSVRELRANGVVDLLGPPLARACTAVASDDWIQVVETDDGFAVSVDRAPVGVSRGRITFTGPAGEAVVPVIIEVAAPVTVAPEPVAEPAPVPAPVAAVVAEPEPVVAAPVVEKRPAERPSATKSPAEKSPVVERPVEVSPLSRLTVWGALLGLAAAVLLLVAMPLNYRHGDLFYQSSRSHLLYAVVPMAVTALAGAVCLVVARARAVGAGVLVAAGAVAFWGIGWCVGEVSDDSLSSYGEGFWLFFSGLVVLVAAAAVALVVVHRDPELSFQDNVNPLLVGCGIAATLVVLVLLGYVAGTGDDEPMHVVSLLGAAAASLTVLVLAARARPRALAVALVVTWAVLLTAISVTVSPTVHVSMVVLWVVELVALAATAAPRRVL